MYIVKAPYRISLYGGSTDYASYYENHNSLIIGFTIDKYTYVMLRETPKILPYKTLVNYSQHEKVNDNNEIKHNGVRGVLQYLNYTDGLEITHLGDLPARTGIGSSSAFVVALLHAMYKLIGKKISPKLLAIDSIYVERVLLNEAGGVQDGIHSSYTGLNSIEIYKNGNFKVKPLSVDELFIEDFKKSLSLLYLGQDRNSFKIAEAHDTVEKYSLESKHLIHEIAKEGLTAFQNEDIKKIGQLLHESWMAKQKISNLISTPKINDLYKFCISHGAYGGKLLGSGGSGFMLFISTPDVKEYLIKNTKYLNVDFDFSYGGSQIIHNGT